MRRSAAMPSPRPTGPGRPPKNRRPAVLVTKGCDRHAVRPGQARVGGHPVPGGHRPWCAVALPVRRLTVGRLTVGRLTVVGLAGSLPVARRGRLAVRRCHGPVRRGSRSVRRGTRVGRAVGGGGAVDRVRRGRPAVGVGVGRAVRAERLRSRRPSGGCVGVGLLRARVGPLPVGVARSVGRGRRRRHGSTVSVGPPPRSVVLR